MCQKTTVATFKFLNMYWIIGGLVATTGFLFFLVIRFFNWKNALAIPEYSNRYYYGGDGEEIDEAFLHEGMRCKVCGCSWQDPCPGGCEWAEPNLCTACVKKPKILRKSGI